MPFHLGDRGVFLFAGGMERFYLHCIASHSWERMGNGHGWVRRRLDGIWDGLRKGKREDITAPS